MGLTQTQDPIEELITNYNELNSSIIEELDEEPSPLEFMRYVARNTPFVVRGAAAGWEATRIWTVNFLGEFLGDTPVNVAVTPMGNADAPTPFTNPSDNTTTLIFAKPHEEDQPFRTFLSYLIAQEHRHRHPHHQPRQPSQNEVRYAQTQNNNLHSEYRPLFALSHIPPSIPFAHVALQQPQPDAVNLWIGNSRSVTALHRDGYENLYVQIAGQKHFVLLPPVAGPGVGEVVLREGRYRRRGRGRGGMGRRGGGGGVGGGVGDEKGEGEGEGDGVKEEEEKVEDEEDGKGGLELVLEGGEAGQDEAEKEGIPFPIWDPDRPTENATPYSHLLQPMRVTLNPGDMLYLPCLWYHKVSQSCSPEGVCIAVNYWYDMEYTGPLYPLSTFVRSVSNAKSAPQKQHGISGSV